MVQRSRKAWAWRHIGAGVSLLLVVGLARCEAFSTNKISAPSEMVCDSTVCKGGNCAAKRRPQHVRTRARGVPGTQLQAHSDEAQTSVHTRTDVRSAIVPFDFPWKHRVAVKEQPEIDPIEDPIGAIFRIQDEVPQTAKELADAIMHAYTGAMPEIITSSPSTQVAHDDDSILSRVLKSLLLSRSANKQSRTMSASRNQLFSAITRGCEPRHRQ